MSVVLVRFHSNHDNRYLSKKNNNTNCCIHIVVPPDDEPIFARNLEVDEFQPGQETVI
jgi:hypothetical protein